MFGYTTTLRSMTEGRGSMTMEFDHYDVVPKNVATTSSPAANNYLNVSVDAPKNGPRYLYLSISDVNDSSDILDWFVGPYPRKGSDGKSSWEIMPKTFNGYQGIEKYGPTSEGVDYNDSFLFKGKTYIYQIFLDPILEGRITAQDYPDENTNEDPAIYSQIIESIRLSK
jgi:hypothetical protein